MTPKTVDDYYHDLLSELYCKGYTTDLRIIPAHDVFDFLLVKLAELKVENANLRRLLPEGKE